MNTVYWTPTTATSDNTRPLQVAHMLFPEPIPMMQMIVSAHPSSEFLKCPAFIDFCRNVFIITAPLEVTMTYDATTGHVRVDKFSQQFFDTFCKVREDGTVSFPPAYVFFSTESVVAEVMPPPLLVASALNNTMVVPGMFNIGKWVRPIEFAFAMQDKSQPVVIKKGDPLFAVRFTPSNNSKVVLERVEFTNDMENIIDMGLAYKNFFNNTPLKYLYELASGPITLFLAKYKKPRKCPFNFGGKK